MRRWRGRVEGLLPGPVACTQVAGVRRAMLSVDFTTQTWAGL